LDGWEDAVESASMRVVACVSSGRLSSAVAHLSKRTHNHTHSVSLGRVKAKAKVRVRVGVRVVSWEGGRSERREIFAGLCHELCSPD